VTKDDNERKIPSRYPLLALIFVSFFVFRNEEPKVGSVKRSGKGKNTNLPFLFWVCVFLLPFPLRFVFRIVTNGKIQIIQRKLICGLFSRWLRYDSKDKGKHTTHT
jgi:hypothetical protein